MWVLFLVVWFVCLVFVLRFLYVIHSKVRCSAYNKCKEQSCYHFDTHDLFENCEFTACSAGRKIYNRRCG